jgi:hypothetical protein
MSHNLEVRPSCPAFNWPSTSMTSMRQSRSTPSCSTPSRPNVSPATPTSPWLNHRSSWFLIENPGKGGSLNHLGVEVESTHAVRAEIARLGGAGLSTEEETNTTCCFATQDKVWVTAPDDEKWEIYTKLADAQAFGGSVPAAGEADACACNCGPKAG